MKPCIFIKEIKIEIKFFKYVHNNFHVDHFHVENVNIQFDYTWKTDLMNCVYYLCFPLQDSWLPLSGQSFCCNKWQRQIG